MKVLITENRLHNAIYQYIDDTFDINNIDYFHPDTWNDDEYEDEENPYIREYFYHIYQGDYDQDGIAFVYIEKEYYKDEPSNKSFREQSPILIVNDWENLTGTFGNHWIEPMKEWFEDKFGLPVKTITAD
jgi:hypothetical protein